MALNREDFILDEFAVPKFDPGIADVVKISGAPTFLSNPSNLDRIKIELIDQVGITIESRVGHISEFEGITFENEFLHIDTFNIVANIFGKTTGIYTLRVSGFRNYIHAAVTDPDTGDEVSIEAIDAPAVQFGKLEVVEVSTSRKEIRLRGNANTFGSFQDFFTTQTPYTIPSDGFYWKFEDNYNVYFATFAEGYNKFTNKKFSSPTEYALHREARGYPGFIDNDQGEQSYDFSAIRIVDENYNLTSSTRNKEILQSNTDIWPAYIQLTKPTTGDKLNLIGLNWMYDSYTPIPEEGTNPNNQPDPIDTIIFKLAAPASRAIGAGVSVDLIRPLFVPFELSVDIDIPFLVDESFSELRGPNLRLGMDRAYAKGTLQKNEEDIIGTNADIKSRLETEIISGSGNITQNYNFKQFKNFVHFSSAEERLKNFKYKLQQIEHYDSKSAFLGNGFSGTDSDVTGSEDVKQERLKYERLRRGYISSFSPYEKHLYYNSSSTETIYTDDGELTINPTTWPKSNATQSGTGYTLFSITSSEGVSWYNSQIISASDYDAKNSSYLRNVIPTHVRVDSDNDSFGLFFDMVGEHFDKVYSSIKDLEERHVNEESLYDGMSKDLLLDAAKSFGFNLYPGFSSADLWDYVLGTNQEGVFQSSGSGETRNFVKKEAKPAGDIEKQIWKRIVNNIPYFLKTKGTSRGVKALLASYGVPLTILNIDEYGGAPATRKDDKRAIQKFVYGLNMNGTGNNFTTTHKYFKQGGGSSTLDSLTNATSYNRFPSMYEVRVDTATTRSMTLARTNKPPGTVGDWHWEVVLEPSSSATGSDSPSAIAAGSASAYAKYGRVTLYVSASDNQPMISASTPYVPLFDNDWWNISWGLGEHPKHNTAVESQSFYVRCAKAAEHSDGRITHSGSGVVIGNSESYNNAWAKNGTIEWGKHDTDGNNRGIGENRFKGSIQEVRVWAEYVNDDAFYQHALAPTSVVGNTIEQAYNDLLVRLPFGTDGKKYNHNTTTTITSSLPNTNNAKWSYQGDGEGAIMSNFSDEFNYSNHTETYFVKVPHTAGPSKHSNKVRIEDNSLRNNQLSRNTSYEESSFDSNPLDSEDLSVVLSPADEIDTDIAMQFGGFDLDDYIGDPRDKYKQEYTSLRNTQNLYFKKYTGGTNVMAFVRYLRSFNKGLFKQIESMLPARADAIVGLEIRPNLLERAKLNTPVSMSQETKYHTSSISLRTNYLFDKGELINSQSSFGSTYGTLTSLIGVGAPSSQQRSGSNDYYNLYKGSTYLKDVFGETTESGVQTFISESIIWSRGEDFKQNPTFNLYFKPTVIYAPASQSDIIGPASKNISNIYPKSIDIQPNYIYSPAQRRLIIDGTQMSSPDFNVGSSDTIDGGPVVEFVLVNPNIIEVDEPGPTRKPNRTVDRFGSPVSNRSRRSNTEISVR